MRVKIKAPIYINHKDDLKRIKLEAGTIGILDDLQLTSDNTTLVATIRFPEGIAMLNPSMYEAVNDTAYDEIPTNPGVGAASWRMPKFDDDT